MPMDAGQPLTDEDLDRMARQLFAEVRAEHPEAKADRALQTAGALAGEIVPGLPDWLPDWLQDAGDDAPTGDSNDG